jgi:hypothetical protein
MKLNQMSDEELLYWLPLAKPMIKFLTDLIKHTETQAFMGHEFVGWKVVEGRSNRVYGDKDAVVDTLRENGYTDEDIFKPHEILGITAMQKNLGKKLFANLVEPLLVKPPGSPTLVPESDPREPFNATNGVFDDENEGD